MDTLNMTYVIHPESIEKWPLGKHVGVESKLLADGQNITVLWSAWDPGAIAPEHIHPHEQMGICLQGEIIFTIEGKDYLVKTGEYYHIPPNAPHAERNEGSVTAILTDFFSPVRSDLLNRQFQPKIVGEEFKDSENSED